MLLMANDSRRTYPSLQMLLFMILKESLHSHGLSVDPPENLAVYDPGHLGLVEITWSPPSSLINMTDCPPVYQLEYYDTYKDRWAAVRTEETKYEAQFNLMNDVQIRVFTILDGPCTDHTMIKSTKATKLFQSPPNTGINDTAAQNLVCIFQNMEYLECKWKISPKMPANSLQNLYFWHNYLEQAVECPKYIISGGVRRGCNFTGSFLPQFTDMNFCVNGSSPEGPLKPLFITLQIQNHVKVAVTEKLYLETGLDRQLKLHWEDPAGKVPTQCLEWEVIHNQEGPDGKISSKNIPANQNNLIIRSNHSGERNCFRVRSKLHKYCVEQSFWSDWSLPVCHPVKPAKVTDHFLDFHRQTLTSSSHEKIEVTPKPGWEMSPVFIYIAIAIIAMLMLCLSVWVAIKLMKSRTEKKLHSQLMKLFNRNPKLTDAEVNKYKTCSGIII